MRQWRSGSGCAATCCWFLAPCLGNTSASAESSGRGSASVHRAGSSAASPALALHQSGAARLAIRALFLDQRFACSRAGARHRGGQRIRQAARVAGGLSSTGHMHGIACLRGHPAIFAETPRLQRRARGPEAMRRRKFHVPDCSVAHGAAPRSADVPQFSRDAHFITEGDEPRPCAAGAPVSRHTPRPRAAAGSWPVCLRPSRRD